jgi:two-component system cell cycle response regulator
VVAERLRRSICDTPFTVAEIAENLAISCSIGVTVSQAGETLDVMLKRADDALYQAKHDGRNRIVTQLPNVAKIAQTG